MIGLEAASAHRAADFPVFVGRAGADLVVNSSSLGAVLLNGVDVAQLFANVTLLIAQASVGSVPLSDRRDVLEGEPDVTNCVPTVTGPAQVTRAGSNVTLESGAAGSVKINGLDVVRAACVVKHVVDQLQFHGMSPGTLNPVLDRPGTGAGAPDATAGVRRSNGDLIITTAPAGVVMINDVDILATLRGVDPTSAPSTLPAPAGVALPRSTCTLC